MLDRTRKYFGDICNTDGPSSYKIERDDSLDIDRILYQEKYIPVLKRRCPRDIRKVLREIKGELNEANKKHNKQRKKML